MRALFLFIFFLAPGSPATRGSLVLLVGAGRAPPEVGATLVLCVGCPGLEAMGDPGGPGPVASGTRKANPFFVRFETLVPGQFCAEWCTRPSLPAPAHSAADPGKFLKLDLRDPGGIPEDPGAIPEDPGAIPELFRCGKPPGTSRVLAVDVRCISFAITAASFEF